MPSYRCPYCHASLPPPSEWKKAECPQCHKTILVEDGIADRKAKADAKRAALEKIARDAERERKKIRHPPFSRTPPGVLFVGMFTLVIVGGLLVGRTRLNLTGKTPEEKLLSATSELEVLATALGLYHAHTGHYPTVSEGGLCALYMDPGTDGWRGPYITTFQPDPWNQGYCYDFTDDLPEIHSKGPDRLNGTDDDLYADPVHFTPDPRLLEEWRPESAVRHPSVQAQ